MEDGQTERLHREQSRRAENERDLAAGSSDEEEALAHERRAEKAEYLRRRLEEREESED